MLLASLGQVLLPACKVKGTPKRPPLSSLLATEPVDLPADFFELFEEHAERLDEGSVLSEAQLNLAFAPESEEAAGCMRPHICEAYSNCGSCLTWRHVVVGHGRTFLPMSSAKPPREGGGPVKGYLKARQKCLFSTSWFSRTGG